MRNRPPADPEQPAPPAPPTPEPAFDAALPLPEEMADPATRPAPRLRDLFLVWFRIGAFSFGGGAATLFLMRREFVQTQRWLTGAEYNKAYALSKLVPGTNIIAQSILMGTMVAGVRGGLVSVFALLAPAVTVTSVLAAFITQMQRNPLSQAMLAGVVPAAGGLTFAIVVQMIGRNEIRGAGGIIRAGVVMSVCAAAFGLLGVPVPVVLVVAAAFGALFPRLAGVEPDAPPDATEAVASAAIPPPPAPASAPTEEVRR